MSELEKIVTEKNRQEQGKILKRLEDRLFSAQSDCNRRGMLNSSIHVQAVVKECETAYHEAIEVTKSELSWMLTQKMYVTESAAEEVASLGLQCLSPIEAHCREQISRVARRLPDSVIVAQVAAMFESSVSASEGEIRLFVRQWREAHQRGVLRMVLSALTGPFRKS